MQLVPDEAGPHGIVVGRERGVGYRRVVDGFGDRRERGFGGETPRLDRVVHALQGRDVHHPDAVAAEQEAGRVESPRQRVEPTARDGLGAPLDPLAALEDGADGGVRLEHLEQVVRVELRVAVVEPQYQPDRHEVVAHRVDERTAELPVLRLRSQRPPQGVDHAVERSSDLPDLLDAELPHLRRGVAPEAEVVECGVGEMALGAFGEDRHACDEVAPGLEVGQFLAVRSASLVTGAHPYARDPARRAASRPTSRSGAWRPPTRRAPRANGRRARGTR